jgi:DNA-directed RNA polymerase specialized sigma24 family protein
MSKYTYETVTGSVEIEVEQEWTAILEYEDAAEGRSSRRHVRADHKYAPGAPLSLDESDPTSTWICDAGDEAHDIEVRADFARALDSLTVLQRYCVIEICLKGRTYRDVAGELGSNYSTIRDIVRAAKEKIKKYF